MSLPSLALVLIAVASDPVYSPAVRGTVWIRAGDKAVGTGWVVDGERRWVVTARHVLADREQAEVFFPEYRDGRLIADREHYLSNRADLQKRKQLATGKLLLKDDSADLALLALDHLPANTPALSLSLLPALPGHACSTVGHRHDSDLLWSRTTGSVRQTGRLSEGYFWAGTRIGAKAPVLFLQAPIELGDSGAAVLDDRGRVIGVLSAMSNRTPGLAIAIDVSQVKKLLTEARQDERAITLERAVERRPDVAALMAATVWVNPRSTAGRAAGVLIEHGLILTSAAAVGTEGVVDVVSPKWEWARLVAEASEYRDLFALRYADHRHCARGVVLARDLDRDLAIIRLEEGLEIGQAIRIGQGVRPGDRIAAISHPIGEELMWLYESGTVRSVGDVLLRRDGEGKKVEASLLQLPHQSSSSGGAVVNERGELVGILSSREGARQELAYAAASAEIRRFLESTRPMWRPETSAEIGQQAKYLAKLGLFQVGGLALNESSSADEVAIEAFCVNRRLQGGFDYHTSQLIYGVLDHKPPPEAQSLLAEASLNVGDEKRAKELLQAALKANPKLAPALLTRARLGKGKEAMADVEAALEIDPELARAYALRASLRDRKDPEYKEKTLTDLNRAMELEPYNTRFLAQRAEFLMSSKEYKKAARDYALLADLDWTKSDRYLELAIAQFAAGNRTEAAKQLVNALRLHERPRSMLILIHRLGKELAEDNPADYERVATWYTQALSGVLPYLEGRTKDFLKLTLEDAAAREDVSKRAGLLSLAMEEVVKAKGD
jgi:S1-C subfamily serine protease/Tfp pilus assembly protein PilF